MEEANAIETAKRRATRGGTKNQVLFLINVFSALLMFFIGMYQIITLSAFLQVFSDLKFFKIFTPFFMLLSAVVSSNYFESDVTRIVCGSIMFLPALIYLFEFLRGKRIIATFSVFNNAETNNISTQTEEA
ncbi:hypothetical protein PPERSA_06951 [Pseudocohnilembus persalinus]|uniref:Uncharacterized protein n=1 Tax=Pseudocohnilembus persalinus TaxID=266149 RepID=A0A0V0QZL0_PSEPJ|nr:hypothetical protein PPERSA_06951 [Pseudocohnilembus persalinus]|eukprot:KRX07336.1 hypothetical protein PPERSA_06951 [Pseudocohnilembus persalinus]